MRARPVRTHAELLAVTGEDSFVRYELPADFSGPAFGLGSALLAIRRTHTRRVSLLALGSPADLDDLLSVLTAAGRLQELPLRRVTVQHGSLDAVGRHLPLTDGDDWEWMCTTTPPGCVAGEDRLERLDEQAKDEIEGLLRQANPHTDARPFRLEGQRWVGARDGSGRLVACGMAEPNLAGYPILAGITAHPAQRGRGLGLAVTAYLTRAAVMRTGVCTLSMYSDNDVARRVYTGLGYRDVHRWQSRGLR